MDFLTLTIESLALGTVALIAVDFVSGLVRRSRTVESGAAPSPAAPTPPPAPVEPITDPWAEPTAPVAANDASRRASFAPSFTPLLPAQPYLLLLPAAPEISLPAATIDWAQLTPEQLRKECAKRQIKWRNAHGKNKHLKRAEMLALLASA